MENNSKTSNKISAEEEAARRTRILKKSASGGNVTARKKLTGDDYINFFTSTIGAQDHDLKDKKLEKPGIIKSIIRFPFMVLSLIIGCVFISLSAIFAGIHYALKAPNFVLKKLNEGSVKLS